MPEIKRDEPKNLEAEMAVLGCGFLSSTALEKISEELRSDMFYDKKNVAIFNAMNEIHKRHDQMDATILKNEIEKNTPINTVGGVEYLSEVIDSVATTANLDFYINIVKEKATRRKLIDTATNIITETYEEEKDLTRLLDQAEKNILNVVKTRKTSELIPISTALRNAQENLENMAKNKSTITGLTTGFYDLDKATAGLHEGELIILAARPGMRNNW